MMKRELEEISCMGSSELVDHHGHSHIALANCLMFLSQSQGYKSNATSRVFECKTCNKKFTSFQALGGHRASHKKPRLSSSSDHDDHHQDQSTTKANKTTTHECSICGVEFSVGQALGGHMRKHRGALTDVNQSFVPIVKKPNGKRVLWMDLNLTPSENIHLHLRKPTPNFTVNLI